MRTIGSEIIRLLDAKGMTQDQLAEACGVSKGYVSNVSHGRTGLTLGSRFLANMAKALDVPVWHFAEYCVDGHVADEWKEWMRLAFTVIDKYVPIKHIPDELDDARRAISTGAR